MPVNTPQVFNGARPLLTAEALWRAAAMGGGGAGGCKREIDIGLGVTGPQMGIMSLRRKCFGGGRGVRRPRQARA